MNDEAKQALAVAEQMTRAFSHKSAEGFAKLYASDARIWYAATNRMQSREENVAMLGAVFGVMQQVAYEDVTRYSIDGGFVQHHVIRGCFHDGTRTPELHAAMVVTVRDGKITMLREWFDSAQFGEVWRRLGLKA